MLRGSYVILLVKISGVLISADATFCCCLRDHGESHQLHHGLGDSLNEGQTERKRNLFPRDLR